MSYQVLARKWRPRKFDEMVGQEHVVQALSNALEHDRLHHAYLFTGTRGVGKTTLARILSKSLNCETGVGPHPCGVCTTCREIDEGRFADLIEVDAASKTGVDDTRELLEGVPYAPVRGRYKVYLIDEVHMFSGHSFNALLKTLEEPPPHVKFLLATTDPQKVPVTVLSRCLQFNLKRLPEAQIEGQFRRILETEQVQFEDEALTLLARAADGSMRDGLSLLDQAIGFGGGAVASTGVRAMLGAVAVERVPPMLDAIQQGDAAAVMSEVAAVAEHAPDFGQLLRDLLTALHRIAVLQQLPDAAQPGWGDVAALQGLAKGLPPEDVQLYYQIALNGQRDLPLAPDERSGFEMVLLRMLAFRPDAAVDVPPPKTRASAAAGEPSGASQAAATAVEQSAEKAVEPAPAEVAGMDPAKDWHAFVKDLALRGMAAQLAENAVVETWDGRTLALNVDPGCGSLIGSLAEQRLRDALATELGDGLVLRLSATQVEEETPAQRAAREKQQRHRETEDAISRDPLVLAVQDTFDAEVVPESIRHLD